jgi:hypothetical protein
MRASRRALYGILAAAVLAVSCGGAEPRITIETDLVPRFTPLEFRGTGFTPNHNVSSHLVRADGSEFPVLPLLTDSDGAFTHTIDTIILELGFHELWVVDDATGQESNRIRFEITFDYSKQPDR